MSPESVVSSSRNDLGNIVPVHKAFQEIVLRLCAIRDLKLPLFGYHRELRKAPLLIPTFDVVIRIFQPDKVSDKPRNDIVVALGVAFMCRRSADYESLKIHF